MENLITDLHIKNFKSIKGLELKCKRINVFVGQPNTGKSNILEALSLFCTPYDAPGDKVLKDNIRYEKFSNLFYDNETDQTIEVASNIETVVLNRDGDFFWLFSSNNSMGIQDFKNSKNKEVYYHSLGMKDINYVQQLILLGIKDEGQLMGGPNYQKTGSPIKKYMFKSPDFSKGDHFLYLTPPFGNNLPSIIQTNKSLRDDISSYFKDYGLEFVLSVGNNHVEIQKRIGNLAWKYPYSLTSDTLQRMIFYLAAIKSNKNSVLLFEEPEAHTFPSYTAALAYNIVESKDNQFFITTHNPYLLDTILEESDYNETAVFKVSYDNYQTHAKELTEVEIDDILSYGADVFINHKAFGK